MDKKVRKIVEKFFLLVALVASVTVLVILTYRGNYDLNAEFVYTVMDDQSIKIDGYTGDTANLTIPEEIDGYTVKYIGKESFANDLALKKIIIPDSVEAINDYAFSGCVNLKSVEFSKNLKKIGLGAFFGCSSLKNADLPEGLETVEGSAFENCKLLKNLKMPKSCTDIGSDVFLGCENLILDCSENKLAEEIAKKYNIPTSFSESSDSTMLKVGILLALAIVCVFVLPPVIKKIILSVKNKKASAKIENDN